MAALLGPANAGATLGGGSASLGVDRARMHARGTERVSGSIPGTYTVHESSLPTGTLVRQYLSTAGVVFAVTWSGPFKPDLQQLLGAHFDTMLARQAGHVHAGAPLVAQHNADLVVESGGHMRGFVGRAYLPAALPPGVNVQDLQ